MAATNLRKSSRMHGAAHKETALGLTPNLDMHGGSGGLLGLHINNQDSAIAYIKLYNSSVVDANGIDAPWMALAIPATTERFIIISSAVAGGGAPFSSALSARASDSQMVTSGNDGSAPGANVAVTAFTRS